MHTDTFTSTRIFSDLIQNDAVRTLYLHKIIRI